MFEILRMILLFFSRSLLAAVHLHRICLYFRSVFKSLLMFFFSFHFARVGLFCFGSMERAHVRAACYRIVLFFSAAAFH